MDFEVRFLIDQFAFLENGDEHLLDTVSPARNRPRAPRCLIALKEQVFRFVDAFTFEDDDVSFHFPRIFIVNAQDVLQARIGNLFGIVAHLDLRHEFAIVILADEFKDAAQGRTVLGRNQVRADAPGVDGAALGFQFGNEVLHRGHSRPQ